MKYVVTMNGKRYEVEVERMSAFHMLTREEIASGVSTPVQPVAAPAPKAAAPAPAAAPSGAAGSITVEAMKMENEIVAPVDGTVASINVKTGDTVDTDQVMGTLN